MTIIVALTAFTILQNPLPPDVTIPSGWKVAYGVTHTRWGGGAIKGPAGEEIAFHPYIPSGFVAAVQHQMDLGSVYIQTILDRRLVEVTVTSNGLVAASYPPIPPFGRSGLTFDYWMRAESARQAAQMVMITLTRLDNYGVDGLAEKQMAASFSSTTKEYPFAYLRVQGSFKAGGQGPVLKAVRSGSKVAKATSAVPDKVNWKEQSPLIGGLLIVAEGADGRIWAKYVARDRTETAFVAPKDDRQAAVLAIVAALTYREQD